MIIGLIVTVGVVGLAAFGVVVLSWLVADRVLRPRRLPPTAILGGESGSVELQETQLSRFPGPMGLLYENESRHIRLGAVIRDVDGRVVREIRSTDVGTTSVSVGRVVSDPFGTPANAGLAMDEVILESEDLRLPAWILRDPSSTGRTWAIHVHGAMSGRESMLRTANSFAGRGFTSLIVTYRGDSTTQPPHERHGSALGQTEWHDLDPAVAYALANGADRVVLVGMSLGATIALAFTAHSRLSPHVDGLVLVAPILDWKSSIRANVRAARLPRVVATTATALLSAQLSSRALSLPEPLRFDDLDFAGKMAVHVPTLILHSAGDPVAPHQDSQRLARRVPDLVTLATFDGVEHALEWNRDPKRFDEELGSWLECNAAR